MISILLIEDHLLVREAWKDTLTKMEEFSVIGEADNITEAYDKVSTLKPDVILMDINLRGENGAELLFKICNTIPSPKIIIVSMNDEYSFIKKTFSTGAKGYVTKFSPKSDLIEAIKKVAQGETYMCSEVKKLFLQKSINPSKEDNISLSLRELDIIKLIAKGKGNKEIAIGLDLSVKTVEGHKTKIYKKLGVKSIAELITYGKNKGLDF
ncbi:MAG: response regulator transcription factor [Bacteroidota bacterium]|nr:response regulator transcription factor [Bacteroidota bacterium]